MSVNPLRVRKLSSSSYFDGTVVYQMCRDIRAHDNDALLFAQELARKYGGKLLVNYVIWNYGWEGATRRFYDWVIPSLQEVERELRKYDIPLVVTFEEQRLFDTRNTFKKVPSHIGAVVIDQLPLRFMRTWKEIFLKHNNTPLYEVDAHNCIPVWELSPKQEFAARMIRSKIHAKLVHFLEPYTKLSVHEENYEFIKTVPTIDWKDISEKVICNESVLGIGRFASGEESAQKIFKDFLRTKLAAYDSTRNDLNSDGQSNLSPYLAHGNISRRRVLMELLHTTGVAPEDSFDAVRNGSNGKEGAVASFIEEVLVRAELCENFCFYNNKYDSYEGFPLWAKSTLAKAKTDKREYVYSRKEFEEGKTHDALWNAAQYQMVMTGKMHGYMRMYWAKKILEWSQSPEEAMSTAVYLNDTYELDGRDPNGYVGCAWSIGGVHDRAWFPRPIFGTIRYMAESGVKKRGDIELYKENNIPTTTLF
jgi:deoxyribodipyrimidine photo-lyase